MRYLSIAASVFVLSKTGESGIRFQGTLLKANLVHVKKARISVMPTLTGLMILLSLFLITLPTAKAQEEEGLD
jgi:hypothetical protein